MQPPKDPVAAYELLIIAVSVTLMTVFIIIRFILKRRLCRLFHVFIALSSVSDTISQLIRSYYRMSTLYDGNPNVREYMDLLWRLFTTIARCFTAVTAIYWKSVFVKNEFLQYALVSIVGFFLTASFLSSAYFCVELSISGAQHHSLSYIVGYFSQTISAVINSLIIIFCLLNVLRFPVNKYSSSTIKGYRKVAYGLAVKAGVIIWLSLFSAVDALAVASEQFREIANQFMQTEIFTVIYFLDPIFGLINVITNCWMLYGILFKSSSPSSSFNTTGSHQKTELPVTIA